MRTINQIACHHAGGVGSDNFASTRHLTVAHIDRAHKERWGFKSRLNYYAGYNVIYDPKDQSFIQTRAIGEETASIRGQNFNTFHLLVLGNYNRRPIGSPAGLVDPMTEQIKRDVAEYIFDLIDDQEKIYHDFKTINNQGLIIADNVKLNFSISRIYSHRFFSQTYCYGSGLSDNFFRDAVIGIKSTTDKNAEQDFNKVVEKTKLIQTLIKLYSRLLDLLRKRKAQKSYLGAVGDREDPENLPEEVSDYKFFK